MHVYASTCAIAALLAQLVWLAASMRDSAQTHDPNRTARYFAFGVNIAAIALSLGSFQSAGFAVAAAAASIVSTGTAAWYATTLEQSSVIVKSGYAAAVFSTVSAVLLLSVGLDDQQAAFNNGATMFVVERPPESFYRNY
jgi:hypothetical protein